MITFEDFLCSEPFSWDKQKKNEMLTKRLVALTEHHINNCNEYAKMMKIIGYNKSLINNLYDIPFLPVSLFKDLDLKSISDDNIFKTITSSGTTGQQVSKIYLDRETASNQQKTLVKIVSSFTGAARMPMIIIDCPSVIKDRAKFSARGAGILGFSMFGSDRIYALDDEMNINFNAIESFLEKHKDEKILLFGFTFMIWQHFYKALLISNKKLDLSHAVLIHGGGWKKLISESISTEEFKKCLFNVCGLHDIHDYYGMVEQTGCIYMECECGHLHASNFSDIIIRNPIDFSVNNFGEQGIVQVVSSLTDSYPGHSILTEDEGVILGEDDCPCGRKGKYFKIIGRLKNAEIRGCSDTYATKF